MLHEKEFFANNSDIVSPLKAKIFTIDQPPGTFDTPDGFFIKGIKNMKTLNSTLDFCQDDNNSFVDLKGRSAIIQNKPFAIERFTSNKTVSYNNIYDFFINLEKLNNSSYYIPPNVYIYCPLRKKIFRNIYQEGNMINFTENYFQEVSLNVTKTIIKILTHNI